MLVVTPDPAVRELVGGMLRFSGYGMQAPASPREAIEAATGGGVEAVVFDLDYGSFTPELLLSAPAAPIASAPAWMVDRPDVRGRFDLVLVSSTPLPQDRLAAYLGLGRSVAVTPRPVTLFEFRRAMSRFQARVAPTLPRAVGDTGVMMSVPSVEELEAVEPGQLRGRYAANARARPGSEHRADRRFSWDGDAVLLGQAEEPARIVEISRVGLRIRKRGRELNPDATIEVAMVERVETPRGSVVVGLRARGRVVWTAEGMTDVHAGLSLEAVEPLGEFIQLLVGLRAVEG